MLIGMMLVRNEADRWLRQVLEQMRQVCDKIIVLDDCSTDNTPNVCLEYGAIVCYSQEPIWATNEVSLRKFLWYMASLVARNGDWILCLDADETIHNIDLLPACVKAAEECGADGLAFSLYDMWSPTHYRYDDFWNAHTRGWVMCVRYDAGKEYTWRETALHCGRLPVNSCDLVSGTGLKIQHWGWSTPEDRQTKYERYIKADPDGEYGIIGQYLSILDDNPNLKPFFSDTNSKEWWENEFKENWRVGIDGVEQTRYFMKRILEVVKFPENATVLDWGCAMGQGVEELNKAGYNAEGYDFSETAIKTAKGMYPGYNFTHEWPQKTYDAVITSNCLEHFTDPVVQTEEILKLSNKYLVIMTPYNQTPSDVHPVTINENTFPQELNGFRLKHSCIVPSKNVLYDGGEQILFVYERYI